MVWRSTFEDLVDAANTELYGWTVESGAEDEVAEEEFQMETSLANS